MTVLTVRLVCSTEMWLRDRREADILLGASESHFLWLLLLLPSTLFQMSSQRTAGTQSLVLKKGVKAAPPGRPCRAPSERPAGSVQKSLGTAAALGEEDYSLERDRLSLLYTDLFTMHLGFFLNKNKREQGQE